MVRSSRVGDGQRLHADVLERTHPGIEDRCDGRVPLLVHSANLAGAVVQIEVSGELRVLGHRVQAGAVAGGKVLLDVGARTEQSLLLSRPEADADGSPRL